MGSKVCIFSGTKINFSGTKINFSGTKNNISGTKINFSATKFLVPLILFLVRLKLFLVPLKIQTFEPNGTPYVFNYDTRKTISEGVIIQLMPPTNIL